MARHEEMQVRFDAFDVALQAKVGGLQQLDIDALVAKAEQLLTSNHRLAREICAFATDYEVATPEARRALGDRLLTFVQSENVPQPPGLDRSDIYG